MWYPRLLQNIILPFGDKVFRSTLSGDIQCVKEILEQPSLTIQKNQYEKLNNHLGWITEHSSYYKHLVLNKRENPYLWLKEFPILTKGIILNHTDLMLTEPREKLICNSTSGSSGVQTNIYINKKEQSFIRALQTTWWVWAGYVMGNPIFQTGLATHRSFEKRLKDFFFRTHYQFAFGLTEDNTKEGFRWARETKPFLGGYASSLYVLSELAEYKGVKMKSAVSWGDKLFDHYRKNIERIFGCKVYETYGTGEGLMLGAQKDLDYLYIMDPFFIVELLDDEGNDVEDGKIGHVVVTSLIHKAMPLVRYKVGDLAVKLPRNQYPLERELGLSLFQKIIGRETDIVETPLGKKLIVHSFTGVFEYYPEIKQFQVLQRTKELLIIRYIIGANFEPTVLKKIKNQLDSLAEELLNIDFIRVDEISSSKSGKPQIVIKEI
jgi:phenylacetate-CoA ligase